MNAHATALTVLALLLLLPATASAAVFHVVFGYTEFGVLETLGPIPPEICEPVSITVDVPPGMNTHEECLPPFSPQPSFPPFPSESIEAPDES